VPRFLQPSAFLSDEWTLVAKPVLEIEEGILKRIHPPGDIPGRQVQPFSDEVWTRPPALLHAHGESYHAPSKEFNRHSFAAWVKDLLAWRACGEDVRHSFRSTMRGLRQAGTGHVVFHINPDSGASVMAEFQSPLEFPFWEFLSSNHSEIEGVFAQWQTEIPNPVGVALHAPYSVSLRLAKKVAAFAAEAGIPLSVHLGEHNEERQYLKSTTGPLAAFMASKGRPLPEQTWASPLDWLAAVLPESPGPVWVVHGGDLTVKELGILKAKGIRLIWCPGTHRYFNRPKPQFFQAGMLPPCLGCDSMASNTEMNPLMEFRLACEIMPEYSAQQWWGAMTSQAENWLSEAGLVGVHSQAGPIGKQAHFLRLLMPAKKSAAELCLALALDSQLQALSEVDFLNQEFTSSTY
jgi:cytosine/adenosine deaminase-related metal-dependent hydrolase